jgi:hypothetical protein
VLKSAIHSPGNTIMSPVAIALRVLRQILTPASTGAESDGHLSTFSLSLSTSRDRTQPEMPRVQLTSGAMSTATAATYDYHFFGSLLIVPFCELRWD